MPSLSHPPPPGEWPHARVRLAALALLLTAALRAAAGEPETVPPQPPPAPIYQDPLLQVRPDTVPDDATLEAEGAVIGEIEFEIHDVFDPNHPKEKNFLFRAANKLHLKTRQGVIRHLLLFRPGDTYSARILAESERVLRATRYLFDARIVPVAYEDHRVRVRVVTRDVWTLVLSLSLGRAGGENSYRIGVEDANLLGFGKDVTLQRREDVDRTSALYRYRDPNLGGTRWRTELAYQDNSDGFQRRFDIDRPFFSLDTRWSTHLSTLRFDRVDSLYTLGEIRDRFRQITDYYEAGAGFSRGVRGGTVRRWSAGLTYDRNRFGQAEGYAPSPEQPRDRLLVYPWIGFESIRDKYTTVRNLDKIERTEDFNFGREFRARLGWSSTAFGADRDQAVFASRFRTGLVPGPRQFILVHARLGGRYGSTGAENLLLGGSARYDMPTFGRHMFHIFASVDVAHNLDGENQLVLGGETGLRGYPLRYQEGDRRYRVSVEQRFYTPWNVLRLFNVGAAVFADAGAAWFADDRDDPAELGLLKDVGFGLRLSSTRSSSGTMVHVDLAFPLDGIDSIDRVQFVISAQDSF